MRVAVFGAGLSGLAAAGRLAAAGHEVCVLEKSRGLGGRMATRRTEGTVLDHGCPALRVPAGSALAALLARLPREERVELADGETAFRPGITWLAKRMADGLEVRTGVRLAEPDGRLDADALNPPGVRVGLSGDAFCGPDLSAVYDEGLAAADRVLALAPAGAGAPA